MQQLDTLELKADGYRLSGANHTQVIVAALILDDGSRIADWDFDAQGQWGQGADFLQPANPEPAFPADAELIGHLARHLGVAETRVSLGDWDGCDGRLDEAIATVYLDGEEIAAAEVA